MADKTWKASERRVAAAFGAKRTVGSGSMGREDRTSSDSTHERLYIEAKYRARTAVRSLFDSVRRLAKKEGKIPVCCLVDKGRPGFLVVVHSDDLKAFAREVAAGGMPEAMDG